jgi:uracil-DNA glycosylase family 4
MIQQDYIEYCETLGFDPSAPFEENPTMRVAVPTDELEQIKQQALVCVKCRLCESRKKVVFGEGNLRARLMFVGEAPGFNEDQQGRPFVGSAGELLAKMISAMGFSRDDVYIANVIKCRPPENRDPEAEEIAACSPYLQKQIELISPNVIVALGTFAAQVLLENDLSISRIRGKPWPKKIGEVELTVFPTFHPAFLLRNAERKKDVWEDLQKVIAHLNAS